MLPLLSALHFRLIIFFIFIVYVDKCSGNVGNVDEASKSVGLAYTVYIDYSWRIPRSIRGSPPVY